MAVIVTNLHQFNISRCRSMPTELQAENGAGSGP
jgi:hypothetical protein